MGSVLRGLLLKKIVNRTTTERDDDRNDRPMTVHVCCTTLDSKYHRMIHPVEKSSWKMSDFFIISNSWSLIRPGCQHFWKCALWTWRIQRWWHVVPLLQHQHVVLYFSSYLLSSVLWCWRSPRRRTCSLSAIHHRRILIEGVKYAFKVWAFRSEDICSMYRKYPPGWYGRYVWRKHLTTFFEGSF